jgi:TRAP-type mannitol/chloroaromatic compound transport system substrate-binding protein
MMRRRHLLAAATATSAAGALSAPALAQGAIRWNMVMPWPRLTPGVGVAAQRFAERVGAMSGKRLEIKLFAAGELVPPFGGFDAVQSGAVQIAHGTPYYWAGKSPVLHWFTGVPFGLTANELAAWITYGEGGKLWREVYDGFGVVPFYAGSSGVQAGGWFRKEIATLDDLKGLKFRIAGLGGEVVRRLGAVPVSMPPGEIMQGLTSGAIDAAEWIGPWNDRAFGLYKVAKFYYVPAFHEPGPGLEIIVNKEAWSELTPDLQAIVEAAASAAAGETLADFTYHNIESFAPLLVESGVELRSFDEPIVRAMGEAWAAVSEEYAAKDPMTRRVVDSFNAFLRKAQPYAAAFDGRMLAMREIVLRT